MLQSEFYRNKAMRIRKPDVHYARYVRGAIIAGLVILTLTPHATPFEQLPVPGLHLAAQLSLICSAVLYATVRRHIARTLRYVLNKYILALLVFWLVLLAYVLISDNVPYGLLKSAWFFVQSILPLVGLAVLAPFDHKDLRLVLLAIVLG